MNKENPEFYTELTASSTNSLFVEKLSSMNVLWKLLSQVWNSFGFLDLIIDRFLSEIDTEYGHVLYHKEVWWLTCGTVLKWLLALRLETNMFMTEKHKVVAELGDE